MTLHEKIAVYSDRRGLSQRDVGRLASERLRGAGRGAISPASINRIFNGKLTPDAYQAAAIAAVLGLPLAFLVDDDQAEPPGADEALDQLVRNASVIGYAEANRRLLNYGVRPSQDFDASKVRR